MPGRLSPLFVLAVLALGLPAGAWEPQVAEPGAEIEGVRFPRQVLVGGKPLRLNGVGLRQVLMFKPYVAALWAVRPTRRAEEILAADEPRRLTMAILADLPAGQVEGAFRGALGPALLGASPEVRGRLEALLAQMRDVRRGERIVVTYEPATGTVIEGGTRSGRVTLAGKAAADAVFSIWLGPTPVDGYLKAGLLGDHSTGHDVPLAPHTTLERRG
jgi:hypothetical protein